VRFAVRLRARRLAAAAAAAGLLACWAAATAAPAAAVPRAFYGITPATELNASELERMGLARVGTLRVPLYWPHLQPESGADPQWEQIDSLVLEAAANGIRLLPFVYGTPDWVAPRPTTPPLGSAEAKQGWKGLLAAVDERYGPGGRLWDENPDVRALPVKAVQIWNEPNSRAYWTPTSSAPERYAKLLDISDRVLDRGPGRSKVVTAGVFASPPHGMFMTRFLRRLYGVRGSEKRFDALALHPYGPEVADSTLQLKLAKGEMRRARDRRTPIWVTEIGWATDGHPDNPYYTTLEQQAKRLRLVFERILDKRRRWEVDRLIWYTWRDNEVNPECDLCRYSGLFDANLNPKPSWDAFVEFTGGTP
jgi:hypothetical protein